MAGLVAMFSPDRTTAPAGGLAARFSTHAERRDEWNDRYCAVIRLHHGVVNAAPQPLWNGGRTVALFSDGELFDSASPRSRDGGTCESAPEVWLRLFESGRAEAFAGLNGSFALIVYDVERRRIHLISDRHGSRPLYYFVAGSEIVVASQIAALTAHPRCPRRLDRQALHELVAGQRVLGHGTIYHGIQRLQPATVLEFDGRSVQSRRYWELRWRRPTFSRKDAPAVLADGIAHAVRRRMHPNLRSGLLLSGGLDSRAILAASDQPPICFTQAAMENEETDITREAARVRGAAFHFVPVEPAQYYDNFDEAVRLSGGMQRAHAHHFLHGRQTIKQHCDVLLVGYGFDAVFRGREMPGYLLSLGHRTVPLPMLEKVDRGNLVEAILDGGSYMLPQASVRQILRPEVWRENRMRLAETIGDLLRDFDWSDPGAVYNAWDYLGLRSIGQDDAYANVLSIRSWMDDRVPVFDRDLFELYLQMPPEWRYPETVYVAALRRLLPPPLARLRTFDTGLPASFNIHLATPIRKLWGSWRLRSADPRRQLSWPNFGSLLRQHASFRKRLRGLPHSDAMIACEMFDRSGLEAVIDQHLQGRRDHSKLLLMLLTIESWIRQFGADGIE